jgi:hypothetical protein
MLVHRLGSSSLSLLCPRSHHIHIHTANTNTSATRRPYTNSKTRIIQTRVVKMDAEARKAEREARKAEDRQWKKQSEKIEAGHSKISKGIVPEPSGMGEPKGAKGALALTIHRLQQELVEAARLRGEEGTTTLKTELEARKLSDDLEKSYHEKYEAGLRKLRDDLRLAALADAEEQTVDTLGETFRCLSRMFASASPEVRRKTVESLPAKFGVALAGSIDVQEMLVEVEPPGNKKHPRDCPDNADESQTKRNKGSANNDVAPNSNSDDAEVNGTEADKPESEDDASSKKMSEVPSTKETENEDDSSTEKTNDKSSNKETGTGGDDSSDKIDDESPAKETATEDDDDSSDKLKDEKPAEDEKPNPANDPSNKISDNAITAASHSTAGTPVVHATLTQSIDEALKSRVTPSELQPLLAHQIEKHSSTSTTTTTTVTNITTTTTVTTSTGEACSCLP